ncbi:MAG: hypothetical protein ACJ8IR_05460 [Alphaproteobacteria bacterium]
MASSGCYLSIWDELVDEFRALGGVANNVRLDYGPFGRGLFPVDPKKPVTIRIPEALLVDVQHIRFTRDGTFFLSPAAPVDVQRRAFLENYQRNFSWGVGQSETGALVQMLQAASDELRTFLKATFKMDPWFDTPLSGTVPERFFSARYIAYKDRGVLMPIVELANHGRLTRYEREDGIGLSGTFDDEILVRYGDDDPLEIFENWGFGSESENFALSLPLNVETTCGPLAIRRDKTAPGADRELYPAVSVENGRIELSLMVLGHRREPRLPRENFYRALTTAGLARNEAKDLFERIREINRSALSKLVQLADLAAPPLRDLLRRVANLQLELLSHCAGHESMG